MPKRKQYAREFKLQAIELWQSSGKTAAEIEDDLGLTRGRLYERKSKLRREGQLGQGRHRVEATEQELRRLRRELEIVTEERDFRKKQWPSWR